ncbi:Maintenance of telomere capping protein 6 [Kalmusia sp. IMI 367209]|nr:Maintenance of telomere capping protein 6 [Kalmusia sp. IMI 367209]
MTLNYLTGIFNDFLGATATTTDASFTYLLLNIHSASSWAHPDRPAQQPPVDRLPSSVGNLLGSVMKGNLSDELYTPRKLADERADLRTSWNNVGDENQPREGYNSVQDGGGGWLSTDNGWPNEAYIQFREFYRLIAVFGSIDPQMSGYNTSDDADTIFPSDTIRFQPNVTTSTSGTVDKGCLFDPSAKRITPTTNSSFTLAALPSDINISAKPDLFQPIGAVSSLTACGLSPLLNHTLANVTADQNLLPYAAYTHSYLWSWAPGEPLNATDPGTSGTTGNRCAAAYTSGPYPGRWHVVNCTSRMRAACQDPSSPYSWKISKGEATYGSAASACELPYVFSVPHTPLENAHLLSLSRSRSPSPSSQSILLNFNSLDVADCWVAEVNATCPYLPSGDLNQTRIVVVPTVAAIIIFVCAALTFFVKCAANRREGKRGARRRMVGGWEYEGVPS